MWGLSIGALKWHLAHPHYRKKVSMMTVGVKGGGLLGVSLLHCTLAASPNKFIEAAMRTAGGGKPRDCRERGREESLREEWAEELGTGRTCCSVS
jgi:hypothetical protein